MHEPADVLVEELAFFGTQNGGILVSDLGVTHVHKAYQAALVEFSPLGRIPEVACLGNLLDLGQAVGSPGHLVPYRIVCALPDSIGSDVEEIGSPRRCSLAQIGGVVLCLGRVEAVELDVFGSDLDVHLEAAGAKTHHEGQASD
jgi:hypothetical protein